MQECIVKQLIEMYRDAGELQKLNLNRRPKTHLNDEEKAIIDTRYGKKRESVPDSSFTSAKGRDSGYHTIRYISASEKLIEQRPIQGNRRKESGVDMRGNIPEV